MNECDDFSRSFIKGRQWKGQANVEKESQGRCLTVTEAVNSVCEDMGSIHSAFLEVLERTLSGVPMAAGG